MSGYRPSVAFSGPRTESVRVLADLIERLSHCNPNTCVSLQLQWRLSIGIASHCTATPALAYSCNRDSPQGLQL